MITIDERALRETLAWHFLTGIECDHDAKTDVATCACALWRSEPQPSVGAAVERWAEHVADFLTKKSQENKKHQSGEVA